MTKFVEYNDRSHERGDDKSSMICDNNINLGSSYRQIGTLRVSVDGNYTIEPDYPYIT